MMEEDGESGNKALKIARSYYKGCMASIHEPQSRGGAIRFILEKIRQFGSFPLIDKSWSYGDDVDLTDLLAYFNKNGTVTNVLVPQIGKDLVNMSRARIFVSHKQ
ncbi:hypothetical protein Aduo_006850 [Ancylostoma duodenale]